MTSIVVVRALHLGDLLCATPALRSLRARYPRARITLIGLPWARAFVPLVPRLIDAFEEFPGFPGIPERPVDPSRLDAFVVRMRAQHIDLAVQLHGSGRYINDFTAQLGAERMVAFDERAAESRDDMTLVPWPGAGSEIERLRDLPRALGWPDTGDRLELDVPTRDLAHWRSAAPQLAGRRFACVHPGARFPSRRWSADAFAAVVDGLAARGLAVAVTGTEAERAVTAGVITRVRCRTTDLTGQLPLGAFCAAIRDAALLVSNDTGASHVAAAVGTPSVVVSSGSDVARWAPHDRLRHRVLWHDTPCRPCMHDICPTSHECAAGITSSSVLDAVDALRALEMAHA
jgi:ADP-heptose:LPS heptosyltransferase